MAGGGLVKAHGYTFFVSLVGEGVCLLIGFFFSFMLLVFENDGPSAPRCYLLFV